MFNLIIKHLSYCLLTQPLCTAYRKHDVRDPVTRDLVYEMISETSRTAVTRIKGITGSYAGVDCD